MQDYKGGDMIGSTPRNLTIMQLIGAPVGAAAVSWMYPLLETRTASSARTRRSRRRSRGAWPASPKSCRRASARCRRAPSPRSSSGAVLGVVITVMEKRGITWVPSATGVGIGMMVPAAVVFVMFLGGVVEAMWKRQSPDTYARYLPPLASGFIAGEAVVAIIIPLLVVIGLMSV